jgi:hypothetical protein
MKSDLEASYSSRHGWIKTALWTGTAAVVSSRLVLDAETDNGFPHIRWVRAR